jgi:hypothetical protein
MRSTPKNIRKMTATRRIENFSSRNRNANIRTNINDDDLHIAEQDETQGQEFTRPKYADVLKKDSEIVLSDRFERPISRPVATAVGTAFFLYQHLVSRLNNADGLGRKSWPPTESVM